ncbi:uncharacterized protein LOC103929830 isoform X1 [Pyrus x bretschneideri]|uniref:uncharacterized protein LOC103929830 isoform X1 n=1 Tax=Pyrus x bretschneideri TaxID=225117 RepID=UPI00203051D0|nr:uncharacterized protein LOC103929830 isoform X1 [Pyrus x bretschneideri]XP_009337364.2 uncharacterized protein LOC103929830 isoform X1 [Pyrus x bretschneideri]
MDGCRESRRNSNDQQSLGTSGSISCPTTATINQEEQSKSRKASLSCADLHYEITKDVNGIPPNSIGNHQKQRIDRKKSEEDELVKYMSKLPSYLERGKNLQEKVLNVGVLDWGRLEKWQHRHKQMPYRSSRNSPSSSNTTSCFSTDESSTHSSRGQSCSPAHPRVHRPSLESHFVKSPTEGHSEVVNCFRERVETLKDLKAGGSSTLNGLENFIGADKSLCKNRPDIRVEQYMRKDSDPKCEPKKGVLRNGPHETADHGELMKKSENLHISYSESSERDIPEGCQKVVLLLPRDFPANKDSGVSNLSDSIKLLHQREAKATQGRFSDRPKEACHAELRTVLSHSCPFSSEDEGQHSLVKQLGSTDATSIRLQSSVPSSATQSFKTGTSSSRGIKVEEKKTAVASTSSTISEPYKGLELKPSKATAEKVRSTSPFRRFSIGVGKTGKSSSSKDCSDVQQLSSTSFSANPGSENTVASTFTDASDGDKSNATGRSKSSPLRRLLDPLLKPKVANCHHVVESSEKGSISKNKVRKSSEGWVDSLSEQPGKVKLGMTGCRTINVNESAMVKKSGSAAVQALLRVAVKNGQPLFTFAVENDIDILAATTKKLNTSKNDDCSCIYTFFSIRNVKKKIGIWMHQGSKSKSHDYVRNVVAQMKVADSQFPNLVRLDGFSVREFVLFSVNLRQADCQTSEFQPNDELAAAVVKIPKKINQQSTAVWRDRDNCSIFPAVGSDECLSRVRRHSYSGEAVDGKPFVGTQGLISTTVILPSGTHSLPSNGGPSSLIERWISGGSCDCGGWDLGCKLRIFDNQNQVSEKKLTSRKVRHIPDRFELFSEGGIQENQPAFSLAPFKDGIYSVEFNPSLSVLQAFSFCIAVLDSRNLCEFSGSRNSVQEKPFEETMLMQNDGLSAPNQMEGEVPARYASYPPLSPVGRV